MPFPQFAIVDVVLQLVLQVEPAVPFPLSVLLPSSHSSYCPYVFGLAMIPSPQRFVVPPHPPPVLGVIVADESSSSPMNPLHGIESVSCTAPIYGCAN